VFSSNEAKPVVQDKISEVASGLISAYDSGELTQALVRVQGLKLTSSSFYSRSGVRAVWLDLKNFNTSFVLVFD
jgi:hypothetical protein